MNQYRKWPFFVYSEGGTLEAISKPPRNNHDTGNVKENREGKYVMLEAVQKAAVISKPGDRPFDFISFSISSKLSASSKVRFLEDDL